MGTLLSKSSGNKEATQQAAAATPGECGNKTKPTTTETTEASTVKSEVFSI